jgi:N-acyl-D-glutamate deacylase
VLVNGQQVFPAEAGMARPGMARPGMARPGKILRREAMAQAAAGAAT